MKIFRRQTTQRICPVNQLIITNHASIFFGKYLGLDKSNTEIDEQTLIGYIEHLKAKTKANDITINSYLRGIRVFLYYCMELGYICQFKIPLLKTEKKIKETYSDFELQLLLKKPNIKKCGFNEYRNWVMTNYFIATGNRMSTVCNLKIEDLNFSDQLIILRKTKNRKQQIIPMSKSLGVILSEYLKFRKGKSDDYLFCNIYGLQLTKSGIEQAIRRYNRSRGVEKTSIHLYRHTFAKKWVIKRSGTFSGYRNS